MSYWSETINFYIKLSFFLRHLDRAKRGVSVGGLGILAKHRKKQHLLILLESLRTIKTLVRSIGFIYFINDNHSFVNCQTKFAHDLRWPNCGQSWYQYNIFIMPLFIPEMHKLQHNVMYMSDHSPDNWCITNNKQICLTRTFQCCDVK